MKKISVAFLIVLLFVSLPLSAASDLPRLVVQITVDQLRGDLPLRYRDRFAEGGFRYFLDHGTWYAAANQPHSHTETVVGHTTLATGAFPSRHGMISNKWYDRITNQFVNNVEGPQYPLLSVLGEDQSDPGASPIMILTTTFSDELAITTAGRAKIYSVSVKDRGAIPLGGHAGKSFWLSLTNGCFVSSTFYYSEYPKWVKAKCEQHLADKMANTTWNLLRDQATYLNKKITNQYPAGSVAEQNMEMLDSPSLGFNRTFPHKFAASGGTLYNGLTISPRGDELTLDFAKTLIKEEHLGKHSVTDYLAVSFSSTDLIAHWFSPASLESEDNIYRLDADLRDLLSYIDKEVGLEHTLIVLSADHGGIEYPEYLQTLQINTGWIQNSDILNAAQNALTARYSGIKGLISQLAVPYIYLDHNVIQQNQLNVTEVAQVAASAVAQLNGIAQAIVQTEMATSGTVDDEQMQRVRRNYNATRSGDIYVVQEPQWQIESGEEGNTLVQHGTPWAYDTYVPVAFAGGHIPKALVLRSISTADVAATLAVFLRTKYPSGNVGEPLTELTAKPSH